MSLWTGGGPAVEQAILDREVDFGLVVNPSLHPELVLTQLFYDAIDFYVLGSSQNLAYRADGHRTRAANRLKDALIDHGRRLGSDTVSQRIEQELRKVKRLRWTAKRNDEDIGDCDR